MDEAGKGLAAALAQPGDGAVAFEKWRESHPMATPVDASGVRFEDKNLAGTDWRNIRLDRAVFVRCNLDGCRFGGTDVSLYRLELTGPGSAKNLVIDGGDARWLKAHALSCDNAQLRNLALDNAAFNLVSLRGAQFDRCRLAHARIEHCAADRETTFSNSTSTLGLSVEQEFLDAMNERGGLSDPQLADMAVRDDVAAVKVGYGGVYAWVHAASLIVFVLPYAMFVAQRLVRAAMQGTAPGDPRLWEALLGFILTAGDNWQAWTVADIRWMSVLAFVLVAIYNFGRLGLVMSVYRFERHEAVFRRRTQWKLSGWQRRIWVFVKWGFWVNLASVLVNTIIFLQTRVPP